ncbi:MAG: primosomal protein [Mycobacteriaceae bacterium]|nr:primosomal protein [Mycobacteriaceae bacterium]
MADIVPIGLTFDERDVFTLYAPRWRDARDEWEAFLGKDEDLYAFDSVADLVAFVRTNTDNDLTDHPAWETLTSASAHKLDPRKESRFDLIDVYELLAEKPTAASVERLAGTLAIASAVGSVCELPAISKFFNGNPVLAAVSGGIDNFSGKVGSRRWDEIGAVIGKGWDKVVDAIEGVITTPEVDNAESAKAEAELEQEPPEPEEPDEADEDGESDQPGAAEEDDADAATEHDDAEAEQHAASPQDDVVLGADEDFWAKVGIDPIRMMTSAGTFFTLRCYLDDAPVFLGRNGRISVFGSERSLARYLADEHDHDLSDLATYDDIRTAANDGSLRVDVTDDNVYVLTGIADDLADGPDAVDRDQLELAVELLRDVGDYAEDATVDQALQPTTPLGKLVGYVLEPDGARKPGPPYAKAVEKWGELETFVESRLRHE